MEITTKQLKRVDVVAVSGRIDSSTAPDLDEVLGSIVDAGRFHIFICKTGRDHPHARNSVPTDDIVCVVEKGKERIDHLFSW